MKFSYNIQQMLGKALKGYCRKYDTVDLDMRRISMKRGCYLGDCQNL